MRRRWRGDRGAWAKWRYPPGLAALATTPDGPGGGTVLTVGRWDGGTDGGVDYRGTARCRSDTPGCGAGSGRGAPGPHGGGTDNGGGEGSKQLLAVARGGFIRLQSELTTRKAAPASAEAWRRSGHRGRRCARDNENRPRGVGRGGGCGAVRRCRRGCRGPDHALTYVSRQGANVISDGPS